MSRLRKCDVRFSEHYFSQTEIDEKETGRVFAADYISATSKHGSKYFIAAYCRGPHSPSQWHNCNTGDYVQSLLSADRHLYERIEWGKPCRFYMDLDKPWSAGSPIDVKGIVRHTRILMGPRFKAQFERICVLTSTDPGNKYSHHVIFPDAIIAEGNVQLKNLIVCLNKRLLDVKEKHDGNHEQDKDGKKDEDTSSPFAFVNDKGLLTTPVDLSVYSRNRLLRMLRQSKGVKKNEGSRPRLVLDFELSEGEISAADSMVQCTETYTPVVTNLIDTQSIHEIAQEYKGSHGNLLTERRKRPKKAGVAKSSDYDPRVQKKATYDPQRKTFRPHRSKHIAIINNNIDIFNFVPDSALLRHNDFVETYLPLVKSMVDAPGISEDDIVAWMDHTSEDKAYRIIQYTKNSMPHTEFSQLAVGMRYLRQVYAKVLDNRVGDLRTHSIDAAYRLEFPGPGSGWHPIRSESLISHLQQIGDKDRKFLNTPDECRRLIFITGRMGAGKTNGNIEYSVNQLRKGNINSVAYVAPRRILVDQVAKKVNNIKSQKTPGSNRRIQVRLYYGDSRDKQEYHSSKWAEVKRRWEIQRQIKITKINHTATTKPAVTSPPAALMKEGNDSETHVPVLPENDYAAMAMRMNLTKPPTIMRRKRKIVKPRLKQTALRKPSRYLKKLGDVPLPSCAHTRRKLHASNIPRFIDKIKAIHSTGDGIFYCCCINSIECIPEDVDTLIIDEPAMSMGNLLINWTNRTEKDTLVNCTDTFITDLNNMQLLENRMKMAKKTIVIEAMFTPQLEKAFLIGWRWPTSFKDHLDKAAGCHLIKLPKNLAGMSLSNSNTWLADKFARLKRRGNDSCDVVYNPISNKVATQYTPHRVVIFNDPPRPIFNNLEAYMDFDSLTTQLLFDVIDRRQRVFVFTSTRTKCHQLSKLISTFANVKHRLHEEDVYIPVVKIINSDNLPKQQDGSVEVENIIANAKVVIATGVLGAGCSIETIEFDVAYLFFESGAHTAPIADIIQLTARVRCIQTGTIKYSVGRSGFGSYNMRSVYSKETLTHSIGGFVREINEMHTMSMINNAEMKNDLAYSQSTVDHLLKTAYSYLKPERTIDRVNSETQMEVDQAEQESETPLCPYVFPSWKRHPQRCTPRQTIKGFSRAHSDVVATVRQIAMQTDEHDMLIADVRFAERLSGFHIANGSTNHEGGEKAKVPTLYVRNISLSFDMDKDTSERKWGGTYILINAQGRIENSTTVLGRIKTGKRRRTPGTSEVKAKRQAPNPSPCNKDTHDFNPPPYTVESLAYYEPEAMWNELEGDKNVDEQLETDRKPKLDMETQLEPERESTIDLEVELGRKGCQSSDKMEAKYAVVDPNSYDTRGSNESSESTDGNMKSFEMDEAKWVLLQYDMEELWRATARDAEFIVKYK